MLSLVLYVVGGLAVLVGIAALIIGGSLLLFLPQLVIGGLFLIVGLAIEHWRYKPVRVERPDPRWADTGERFVDPETGRLTAVYFDPASGERHYLAAPESTAP
jgi:predicted membrane channel-forming protein YqfA (hemolysin III family)